MSFTPQTQALRYRVHCYAKDHGLDLTCAELADILDVSPHRLGAALQHKGWHLRLRPAPSSKWSYGSESMAYAGRHIAADVVAGRIGVGEAV